MYRNSVPNQLNITALYGSLWILKLTRRLVLLPVLPTLRRRAAGGAPRTQRLALCTKET